MTHTGSSTACPSVFASWRYALRWVAPLVVAVALPAAAHAGGAALARTRALQVASSATKQMSFRDGTVGSASGAAIYLRGPGPSGMQRTFTLHGGRLDLALASKKLGTGTELQVGLHPNDGAILGLGSRALPNPAQLWLKKARFQGQREGTFQFRGADGRYAGSVRAVVIRQRGED